MPTSKAFSVSGSNTMPSRKVDLVAGSNGVPVENVKPPLLLPRLYEQVPEQVVVRPEVELQPRREVVERLSASASSDVTVLPTGRSCSC